MSEISKRPEISDPECCNSPTLRTSTKKTKHLKNEKLTIKNTPNHPKTFPEAQAAKEKEAFSSRQNTLHCIYHLNHQKADV